ncbi:suppressor of fused domain protein [Rossellomorea marisflavi]|uniref:Suppressor of fused domain protein n=1 Tax=Rossellomorea marisflavi TaxID=189381 RepID=A0A5D4RYK3_9BACI|nr:suppressor of fused domain protein [Rossellomorea marisflavi]TYS54928.1 suppressor of fused domain protein [Rossellomorea marisflavi]
MSISTDHKIIAKTAHNAFGGKPGVSRYWDENNVSNIDMLTTVNRPVDGVSSYSTIGLSDHSIEWTVDETSLRIEIVGASAKGYEQFPNILASCAFCLINSKFSVSHGEVFRNIIQMYYPNIEMKHVLFVSPFLWEDLKTLEFTNKKVAWLLAVPISENEYLFSQEKGTDSLEELFEQEEIDIFDLDRESIV